MTSNVNFALVYGAAPTPTSYSAAALTYAHERAIGSRVVAEAFDAGAAHERETQVTSAKPVPEPHSHHLTRLAEASLRVPGTWLWDLVLRHHLATRPCRPGECPTLDPEPVVDPRLLVVQQWIDDTRSLATVPDAMDLISRLDAMPYES